MVLLSSYLNTRNSQNEPKPKLPKETNNSSLPQPHSCLKTIVQPKPQPAVTLSFPLPWEACVNCTVDTVLHLVTETGLTWDPTNGHIQTTPGLLFLHPTESLVTLGYFLFFTPLDFMMPSIGIFFFLTYPAALALFPFACPQCPDFCSRRPLQPADPLGWWRPLLPEADGCQMCLLSLVQGSSCTQLILTRWLFPVCPHRLPQACPPLACCGAGRRCPRAVCFLGFLPPFATLGSSPDRSLPSAWALPCGHVHRGPLCPGLAASHRPSPVSTLHRAGPRPHSEWGALSRDFCSARHLGIFKKAFVTLHLNYLIVCFPHYIVSFLQTLTLHFFIFGTSYCDELFRRTEELYCLTHTLKAFCLFLKKVKFKYKLCFRECPSEYLQT